MAVGIQPSVGGGPIVPVIPLRIDGSLQKLDDVLFQFGAILVDPDRGGCVAGGDEDETIHQTGFPYKGLHLIGDVDELDRFCAGNRNSPVVINHYFLRSTMYRAIARRGSASGPKRVRAEIASSAATVASFRAAVTPMTAG